MSLVKSRRIADKLLVSQTNEQAILATKPHVLTCDIYCRVVLRLSMLLQELEKNILRPNI